MLENIQKIHGSNTEALLEQLRAWSFPESNTWVPLSTLREMLVDTRHRLFVVAGVAEDVLRSWMEIVMGPESGPGSGRLLGYPERMALAQRIIGVGGNHFDYFKPNHTAATIAGLRLALTLIVFYPHTNITPAAEVLSRL